MLDDKLKFIVISRHYERMFPVMARSEATKQSRTNIAICLDCFAYARNDE